MHLHRGCYPFWYSEPRGVPDQYWQRDVSVSLCVWIEGGVLTVAPQVDNRIRFGMRSALVLKIIKAGSTVIAVQGWKGGLGHTNTLRILSVVR